MNKLSNDITSIIDWYLWNRSIIDINKEYHDKIGWNEFQKCITLTSLSIHEGFLFNYRTIRLRRYNNKIFNIKYYSKTTGFHLPKNYWNSIG